MIYQFNMFLIHICLFTTHILKFFLVHMGFNTAVQILVHSFFFHAFKSYLWLSHWIQYFIFLSSYSYHVVATTSSFWFLILCGYLFFFPWIYVYHVSTHYIFSLVIFIFIFNSSQVQFLLMSHFISCMLFYTLIMFINNIIFLI